MDQELKAKWVAALRSGEFQQTDGVLKDLDGYCCLGVLREIVYPGSEKEDENEFLLHRDHAEEFGLTHSIQKKLSDMNDGHKARGIEKCSFAEIADYIEAKL